jgi:CrcB protein
MNAYLAVAIGGAIGSMARYGGVRLLTPAGAALPWGTLAVNLLGSLAAGLLYVLLVERSDAGESWRALLIVGFLGGFTTFSAFSLETMRLLEGGAFGAALANVLLSVAVCLGACALGLWLGRHLG